MKDGAFVLGERQDHVLGVFMSYFKSLLAAAAFVLCGAGALAATVTQPTNPPYDLLVTATGGGPLDGLTASGAAFWNQSLLTGVGEELMSRSGVFGSIIDSTLGLFFDVGPYTFTEADDDLGPIFVFLDGILQNIDYVVMDAYSPANLALAGVEQFSFNTRDPVSFDGTTIHVLAIVKYIAPVPLPAGLPLLAGALALLAFARRKRLAA